MNKIRMESELKKTRIHCGYTQKSASELIGVPLRTWENWESGIRKPPNYVAKLIIEELKRQSAKQGGAN